MKQIAQTIYITIFSIFFLSCGNSEEKKNTQQEEETIEAVETVVLDFESNKKAAENAALSFYEWYMKATEEGNIPHSVNVIADKNGMCKLDFEPYFNELRKLGTVSEKFMDFERQNYATCEAYMKTIHYKTYEKADGYAFHRYCARLYYYNWFNAQDTYLMAKATASELGEDNKSATVDVAFFSDEEYTPEKGNVRIFLEREQDNWKIVKILFFDEYQKLIEPERTDATQMKFEESEELNGYWTNGEISMEISEESITIMYHGQCAGFYSAKKLNDRETELIWGYDLDCTFDNGTKNNYGLNYYPEEGKPFAKYRLEANMLYVEYYYPDWVKKYGENANDKVFTQIYYRASDIWGNP